jgi:hypothetical protein
MCFHDRLKQFKRSNGEEIKCCPDCTTFDNKRIETLRVSNIEMPKTEEETHFSFLLEEAGLSDQLAGNHLVDNGGSLQDLAKIPTTDVCLPDDLNGPLQFCYVSPLLKKLYNQRKIDAMKRYTMLDDIEHDERARPFFHVLTMPRALNNFCPRCATYATADHECEGDQLQRTYLKRQREQDRMVRDSNITLSNPNVLVPSQILQSKGGYGKQ